MARRKNTDDDELGWSRYSRKFDIPLPPKGTPGTPGSQAPGGQTAGTQTPGYNAPGQPGTAGASAESKAAAKKTAAAKKAAAKKTASSSGSSSYDKILAQQKAEADKTKQRAANKYIRSAEAMQGQARALRSLLGLPIGKGGDPFKVKGGMRTAGPNSKYGVTWQSNWTSKNKDWTRPGQLRGGGLGGPGSQTNNGVRTGTDIKYPPGVGSNGSGGALPTMPGPPKFPGGNQGGGGGQGGGAGQGPRHGTQPPRNANPDDRRPFEDPHRNLQPREGGTGKPRPPRRGV